MRRIRAQTKPEDLDILEIFTSELDKGDEATTEYPNWFLQLFIRGYIKQELECGNLNPFPVWKFQSTPLPKKFFLVHNLKTKTTSVVHSEETIYSNYFIIPPLVECHNTLKDILPATGKKEL